MHLNKVIHFNISVLNYVSFYKIFQNSIHQNNHLLLRKSNHTMLKCNLTITLKCNL